MGLENTFGKAEKVEKEKKLEVITSVDSVVDDLRAYFEKNKTRKFKISDDYRKYFGSCINFLQNSKLSPKIISEFNTKTVAIKENINLGIYLSAMIQTSYNQGCNNFTFEKVSAYLFGIYLKGNPENPIKITAKTIEGDGSLYYAKNCTLTAENIEGIGSLDHAENCTLITKTLKGYGSLWWAENCIAEIQNYQGQRFGYASIENCTIKSENLETLELIKKQIGGRGNNKFKLIK